MKIVKLTLLLLLIFASSRSYAGNADIKDTKGNIQIITSGSWKVTKAYIDTLAIADTTIFQNVTYLFNSNGICTISDGNNSLTAGWGYMSNDPSDPYRIDGKLTINYSDGTHEIFDIWVLQSDTLLLIIPEYDDTNGVIRSMTFYLSLV